MPTWDDVSSHETQPKKITERSHFRLIITGGFLLTLNAGFLGSFFYTNVLKASIVHMSGNALRSGVSIATSSYNELLNVTVVILWFAFGSFSSGFCLGNHPFRMRQMYSYGLLWQATVIAIAYFTLSLSEYLFISEWLLAYSMGLQNALSALYSGGVIRTSHITGSITDIGEIIGTEIRRFLFKTNENSVVWKLYVLVPLVAAYFIGAYLGAVVYFKMGNTALLVPIGLLISLSASYLFKNQISRLFAVRKKPFALKLSSARFFSNSSLSMNTVEDCPGDMADDGNLNDAKKQGFLISQ